MVLSTFSTTDTLISLRHFFDFPGLQILMPGTISHLFSCPGQTVVAEIVILIFSLGMEATRDTPVNLSSPRHTHMCLLATRNKDRLSFPVYKLYLFLLSTKNNSICYQCLNLQTPPWSTALHLPRVPFQTGILVKCLMVTSWGDICKISWL